MIMGEELAQFGDQPVGPCPLPRVSIGLRARRRQKVAVLPDEVSEEQRSDAFGPGQGQQGCIGALQRVHGVDHPAMIARPPPVDSLPP